MNDLTYDVVVIGGGLAGTAIAYNLGLIGIKACLLEAKTLGSGTTGACAGRVQIIESHSDDYLKLVYSGFQLLQTLGEQLVCDLEWECPNHLTLIRDESEWPQIQKQVSLLNEQNILGELISQDDLRKLEPYLDFEQFIGASLSLEGHINPFNLCMGYANAARRHGVKISNNSPVLKMNKTGSRIDFVETHDKRIKTNMVVLAGGAWTGQIASLINLNIPMRFTHAEAFVSEKLPRFINHHIGMTGFYEAVHGKDRTVTLGVGQHRNGTILASNAIEQAEKIDLRSSHWGMPAVAKSFNAVFPNLGDIRIMRTWAAPSPFLPDYNPIIGWVPECKNLYIAAGFHLAVPTIPVLSEMIVKEVLGEKVGIDTEFRPSRFFG